MKTIGIIAEYNPFHNGHAYQVAKIREQNGADFVVAAISGNFIQRGAPAIIDKYARTRMALNCGIDLVIELPVLWATSSAESFATAGVTLFEKMGCVNQICFGAETDNLPLLSSIAKLLAIEPQDYRTALTLALKKGESFPKARAQALYHCISGDTSFYPGPDSMVFSPTQIQELSDVLSLPNNILAIEYLKALLKRMSPLTPYLLKREGAGYHDPAIDNPNASATAIRSILSSVSTKALSQEAVRLLEDSIPKTAWPVFSSYLNEHPLIWANDFSQILGYQLLCRAQDGFSSVADANTFLSNRIKKNIPHFCSFSQFCELNKSRDITYTRMSRILTHLLLGLTNENYVMGKALDYIPYLRILGFRRDSAPLLGALKKSAQVPVISKLADTRGLLSKSSQTLLDQDIFAANLYEQIKYQKSCLANTNLHSIPAMTSEYSRGIVLL